MKKLDEEVLATKDHHEDTTEHVLKHTRGDHPL